MPPRMTGLETREEITEQFRLRTSPILDRMSSDLQSEIQRMTIEMGIHPNQLHVEVSVNFHVHDLRGWH